MSDDKGNDWINLKSLIILCIIMGLVIAGAAIGYKVLSGTQKALQSSGEHVALGDAVSVDYIGMFENGYVFDTSIESVADNDALYPKSPSFATKATYSPMTFTVGQGEMINGFDKGVIGMTVNQTKILTIPPEDAYGYKIDSLIQNMDLTITVPVLEWTTNTTQFENDHYVPAQYGTTVRSHEYGWNMTVYYIDPVTDMVKIKHEPKLHEIIDLNEDWDSQVISIDTSANNGVGEIIILHLLTTSDEGGLFHDEAGQEFTLLSVDRNSDTAVIDYNREVVGQTLVFRVTLLSIDYSP